ncbi:MAG: hypothetical protein ACO4AJ_15415, partial [Prochlorothrix sp.]
MSSLVRQFSAFGFSGSRSLSPSSLSALRRLASFVPPGSSVSVGCARGADAAARSQFPAARVFAVSSGSFGVGRGAFAARSVACVRSVPPGGLWVFFPASPCPVGLLPSPSSSRCFSGFGSGSW